MKNSKAKKIRYKNLKKVLDHNPRKLANEMKLEFILSVKSRYKRKIQVDNKYIGIQTSVNLPIKLK